jgi:hypothetical protein
MEQNTDKIVQDMIALAKKKKDEISKAERPNYKTNCSFRYNPDVAQNINIQVCADVDVLASILGFLITQETNFNEATNRLGLTSKFKWQGYSVEEWQSDLQCRVTKIQITKKKQELEAIESRLDKLISPELRRQMELDELTKMLGS